MNLNIDVKIKKVMVTLTSDIKLSVLTKKLYSNVIMLIAYIPVDPAETAYLSPNICECAEYFPSV